MRRAIPEREEIARYFQEEAISDSIGDNDIPNHREEILEEIRDLLYGVWDSEFRYNPDYFDPEDGDAERNPKAAEDAFRVVLHHYRRNGWPA